MYLIPIALLLFNISFNAICGAYVSRLYLGIMSSISVAVAAIVSVVIFWETSVLGIVSYVDLFEWFEILDFKVNFIVGVDTLAATMIFTICFISFCVHLFSVDYMMLDPSFKRFIIYLTLFTLFMLIMVSSTNLIQLFVGWEGIGIMSYLLINFWYDRPEANRSANKAVFLNKIGDLGLYFCIAFCVLFYHSVDFSRIVEWGLDFNVHFFNLPIINIYLSTCDIISIFIIIAAVGKSAQIGLHAWLPDAMEGPTPVSALLHSATMVTAGVFLLIRMASVLERSYVASSLLLWVGVLTAFMSGFIACNQNDFKKIIAYSTTGQLSLMFIACGSSQYSLALQHLFNHAFFKAALFLIAGSIIHTLNSKQDVRDFGRILVYMPITFTCFLISTFSLLGLPGTSGSVSKEAIIESTFLSNNMWTDIIAILTLISVCLTSFYSIQLLWFVFFKNFNSYPLIISENKTFIFYSITLITFVGAFSGILFQDVFMNMYCFRDSIAISGNYFFMLESSSDFTWTLISELPLLLVVLSGILSLYYHNIFEYLFNRINYRILLPVSGFINRKFFFDFFTFYYVSFILSTLCYNFLWKTFDRFILEIFGPFGIMNTFILKFSNITFYQKGLIYIYNRYLILAFILFAIAFFSYSSNFLYNTDISSLLHISQSCDSRICCWLSLISLIIFLVQFEPIKK
jgi:proton-translocating NADH-quinone oxidoreductase chain L